MWGRQVVAFGTGVVGCRPLLLRISSDGVEGKPQRCGFFCFGVRVDWFGFAVGCGVGFETARSRANPPSGAARRPAPFFKGGDGEGRWPAHFFKGSDGGGGAVAMVSLGSHALLLPLLAQRAGGGREGVLLTLRCRDVDRKAPLPGPSGPRAQLSGVHRSARPWRANGPLHPLRYAKGRECAAWLRKVRLQRVRIRLKKAARGLEAAVLGLGAAVMPVQVGCVRV